MLFTPKTTQYTPESTTGSSLPTVNGYGVPLSLATRGTGYGSYTTITTTGSLPTYGFTLNVNGIHVSPVEAVIRKAVVTIAFGAVGSEIDMVRDILVSSRGPGYTNNMSVYIPLCIPPNTRVSAKIAWDGSTSGTTPSPYIDIVRIEGSSSTDPVYRTFFGCDTYGITSTTTPYGTEVTSGATAGSYGSGVVIGATTRAYSAVLILPGAENATTKTVGSIYAKLGWGLSALEKYNVVVTQSGANLVLGPIPAMPYINEIRSGVSVRLYTAQSNSGALTLDWALYCFY